jgi:hypothetical protein
MDTFSNISQSDITAYRDQLNKLLGIDPNATGSYSPNLQPTSMVPQSGAYTFNTLPASQNSTPMVPPVVQQPQAPTAPTAPKAPTAPTPPVQGTPTVPQNQAPQPSTYQGVSIVDYLNSVGSPTDFNSRKALAMKNGIQNYTGTAQQNTQLLNTLRGTQSNVPSATPNATPSPAVPNAQDVAQQAGAGGLSLQEWTNTQLPTPQETASIAKELGIPEAEALAFKKPSQSSQQIYEKAFATSGLSDVKAQIMRINDEITKSRAELADATGKIDENPFLTEQSRVGRGKRLLAQYEAKINNQLDQVKRLEDLYTQGVNEINNIVTRDANDFGVNQQIDQAQLNYLQKKAEVLSAQTQSKKVADNLPSYLAGKKSTDVPSLVGSAGTGYFRYDDTLKKFVQVIAPEAKISASATASTFNPTSSEKSLVGRYLNTAEGKALIGGVMLSPAELEQVMASPTRFYALLQRANEAGIY